MSKPIESAEQTQLLTFLLAGETYGVSILRVREIIEHDAVTRIPNVPASIRGVINLRGAVVPVVDLAVRFHLGESQLTKRSCVVIVEVNVNGDSLVMGLMADSVSQVIELPAADIEPPPAFGTRIRADYLKGLGKVGKNFVLILDMDRVLSDDEANAVVEAPLRASARELTPAAV